MREVKRVIDPEPVRTPFGIHILVGRATPSSSPTRRSTSGRAPRNSPISPTETAKVARRMGHEPRVAFLSYSTFGNPSGQWLDNIRAAVALLDERAAGEASIRI
jgi:malate dehydrogenase (oxaloacetate-decarboxylating)(NADP+)